MPRGTVYGIFGLGMNQAVEISALTRQVRPEIAIVTNVEAAHLEFFGTVEAIADAKAEIFEGMPPAGVAILNRDNAQYDQPVGRAKAQGLSRPEMPTSTLQSIMSSSYASICLKNK